MNGEKQAWRLPRLIQFIKNTYCINDNKNTYGKQEGSGGEQAGPFTDRAIPHNSKCRYGERGAADAKPKAQIILDAAKVSAASGGNSEPKQGQRSQSARGFCPEARCGYRNPTLSSILATQMPCHSCRSGA